MQSSVSVGNYSCNWTEIAFSSLLDRADPTWPDPELFQDAVLGWLFLLLMVLEVEDNLKSTKPNKICQSEPTKLTKPKLPNQKYQKFALSMAQLSPGMFVYFSNVNSEINIIEIEIFCGQSSWLLLTTSFSTLQWRMCIWFYKYYTEGRLIYMIEIVPTLGMM